MNGIFPTDQKKEGVGRHIIYLPHSQILVWGIFLQVMGTIARSVLQRGMCHERHEEEESGQQGLWPKKRTGRDYKQNKAKKTYKKHLHS